MFENWAELSFPTISFTMLKEIQILKQSLPLIFSFLPSGTISGKPTEQIYRKVQKCWFWALKCHIYHTLGIARYFFKNGLRQFFVYWTLTSYRSSHRRCSVKKGVLRNFAKFTGKHLCQSLFFNKVAGGNTLDERSFMQEIRRKK